MSGYSRLVWICFGDHIGRLFHIIIQFVFDLYNRELLGLGHYGYKKISSRLTVHES